MAKAYNVDNLKSAQAGQTREEGGRDVPGAGLYRHPESGQEAIVIDDPLWGNTQAQAFSRLGFKYVRPAEEGEIKTMPELAMDQRKAEESSLKGLEARIGKLEGVQEENTKLTSEVEQLRKQLEDERQARADAEEAAKKAQAAAKEDQKAIAKAGEQTTTDAAKVSADGAKKNAETAVADRDKTEKENK